MKLGIASLFGGVAMVFAAQAFAADVTCKAVDPITKKVIADAAETLVSKCNRKVREEVKKRRCTGGTKRVKYELQAVRNGKPRTPSDRTAFCDTTPHTDDDAKDDNDDKDTASAPSTGKEGDKNSVTAYQNDGKTVIAVVACEVGVLGPEFPKCVAKTRQVVKEPVCKGKKGRQFYKYRMGNIKTMLSEFIECG